MNENTSAIPSTKEPIPAVPDVSTSMTFYHAQVIEIRENYLPKKDLFRRAIRAKRFIDDNFADDIKLAEIAGAGDFSKFHFLRIFKTIYGRTPHRYLISIRIENAKRILKAQTSVTETCFAVGFESVSSFTGLFKKMAGTTPSAFRNKNRK